MTQGVGGVGASFLYAAVWWSTLVVITAFTWPALRSTTTRWHDRGWALARPIGLLAFALAVWLAAHVFPVFRPDVVRVALLVAGLIVLLLRRRGLRIDAASRHAIMMCELRFLAAFVFYLAIRGLSHDVIGLEKFMDYAFVASAMRSESLPVADPWFAGEAINYYYFGHYVTALLCKLSGVPPPFGYNLMLATIFASVFTLAYAFVAEILRHAAPPARVAASWLAGIWLTVGGNVHGFYYGFVKPWLVDAKLVDLPRQPFLLSDPTRFVGWDPPTDDKLIHEFPAYAFYVGDLHAHLIDLPWVLAFCCVLLAGLRAREAGSQTVGRFAIVLGALLGVFAMTNTWDAMMYSVLLGTLLLLNATAALRGGKRAIAPALGVAALAFAAAIAVAAPFMLQLDVRSEGFFRTRSHTPIGQWLILYGLQTGLALAGCALAARGAQAVKGPERTLLFVLTGFGLGFALLPEFVYLKDIYGSSFYRGNTAFKFGFQAFTLLTLCACVGTYMVASTLRRALPVAAVVVLLELALVPPLYYAWFVVQGGFGVWREREWTLDGHRYLSLNYPDDYAVSRWLMTHASRGSTLIEAVGDSYTYAARISTNSGVPAVLGWPVHEQLWRGSDPDVWRRRDDVDALYRARSPEEARRVIDRYDSRWLILGNLERERYGAELHADVLSALGRIAFRAGDTLIVDLAPPGDESASGTRDAHDKGVNENSR